MLSEEKISLNVISENAAIELIKRFLKKGYNIKTAFIDTVGTPESYRKLLDNAFKGYGITFRVEKKADSLFKVVSAASIVAKVNRDKLLAQWKFPEQIASDLNFGSGYPGDALAVAWLQRNCDPIMAFPTLVRYSWATTTKLVKDKCVPRQEYSTELLVSNDYLSNLGLIVNKSFKAYISKTALYQNLDEMLSVTGRFEL